MTQILKDQVTIITGAGRGIGREYALRFAEEGARLVLPDISLERADSVAQEIKAKGGEAAAMLCDIADEGATKKMVERVTKLYGHVDILLNNAALFGGLPMQPWDSWTVEEWDRIFEINVRGTWLCCKVIAPLMIKQSKGKIINISSNIIEPAPFGAENLLPYTCSKAAVYTLTQTLARALGSYGINVNAIAPGITASEASLEMVSKEAWDAIVARQCFTRSCKPLDLVGAAVFLASKDSDFITGQVLVVDGGVWLR